MKTLILEKPGNMVLADTSEPSAPAQGEALVRVHRVGICGTDLHAFRGKQPFFTYPRILGHELSVEVIAVGPDVTHIKPGDHCAVEPYVNCQKCIACRMGRGNCCTNIRVMGVHTDGGMRERFIVPARKLHVANALNDDQIALVETLAIGAHAVARAAVKEGENVLIVGAGPIGLSVLQFVQAANANPIVLDISDQRLSFCISHLKVQHTINGGRDHVAEALQKLTQGDMPTVVIDATGNRQSMQTSLSYLSHGGRLVYVGLFQGEFTLHDPEFHKRETTLLGSRNALPEDFIRIIGMIEKGVIDTRPWITHRASVEQVPDEFNRWIDPESRVLKAIIEF